MAEHLKKQSDFAKILEILLMENIVQADINLILTVLIEAFNNSLEYGVLKLDSRVKITANGFQQFYKDKQKKLKILKEGANKFIRITAFKLIEQGQYFLFLIVEDSGDGFDYKAKLSNANLNIKRFYGKGLLIIKSIASQMFFNNKGNCIFIKIKLVA